MKRMEFWFEFASTYSYPAVMRVERLARAAGVELVYRPFLLGPIFSDQGMADSPFNLYPIKGRYMWRDLERICAAEGIPFTRPSVFPRNGLRAARVAVSAEHEPWLPAFIRAIYTANFVHDRDIASPQLVHEVLTQLDLDAASVLARADAPENKDRLRAQTTRAAELGIFGAPSFVVQGELFWGNDRLETALAWQT